MAPHLYDSMMCLGKSLEEAQELNKPLVRIGNWNLRTMNAAGKAAQVAREMKNIKVQILGISMALTCTPEERRKQRRAKTTWRRTVEKERERSAWRSCNDVCTSVAEREGWRQDIEA